MFDSLILILKNKHRDKSNALTAVKKWFAKYPPDKMALAIAQANQNGIGAEVLVAAAECDCPAILTYLINQGLDVTRSLRPYGFNILHYCILHNLSPMIDTLLKSHAPLLLETRTREGATPLFLATQRKNLPLVSKLLALGAIVNISDIHGLTPVGLALLAMEPELLTTLLRQATASAILFENLQLQTRLLTSLCQMPENPNKLRCLNVLFSHGAGLELSHIPDDIFSIYKLKREQVKEILIVGECKQADGTYKKQILSTVSGLKSALNNPNWIFETASLIKACQHPLLPKNDISQQLRACLIDNGLPANVALAPSVPNIFTATVPTKAFESLDSTRRHSHLEGEKAVIKNCLRSIQSMPQQQDAINRLQGLASCALQSIHALIGLCPLTTQDYREVLHQFNQLVAGLMPTINTSPSQFALPILILLDEQVASMLKQYGNLLKKAMPGLYNSLVDARALACIKMTRCYLAMGKHDIAITLALEGMALNDQLIIDNPMLQESANYNKALSLASTVQVYIAQGWINKAYRFATEGLALLSSSGCYDDLTIEHVSELANIFAEHNHLGRSLELIDNGITCLKKLFLVSESQAISISEAIPQLTALRASLVQKSFKQNCDRLHSLLDATCAFNIDETTNTLYITPKVDVFSAHLQNPYFTFLQSHSSFSLVDERRVKVSQESLFSKHFFKQAALFADILATEPAKPVFADALKALSELHLTPAEETYGFSKPAGFTPIVPIISDRVPNNTLFLTMPDNSQNFAPFYKLIRHNEEYSPVSAIAPKGLNKQGVKLSTKKVTHPGAAPEKIAYGRLKVDGKWRANGIVEQTVKGENGKQRKLYVFRDVVEKKDELRKGYKF